MFSTLRKKTIISPALPASKSEPNQTNYSYAQVVTPSLQNTIKQSNKQIQSAV
jgi:hypothetical protein